MAGLTVDQPAANSQTWLRGTGVAPRSPQAVWTVNRYWTVFPGGVPGHSSRALTINHLPSLPGEQGPIRPPPQPVPPPEDVRGLDHSRD